MLDQGYGIMPNKVLFDKELSDKAKLLFCFISSLCAEKGFCRAGNEYIAEKMWMSERTAREHIAILAKQGYINLVVEKWNQRKITVWAVAESCHGGGENSPSIGGENLPHNIIIKNNIKEKELEELKNKLEIEYQLPQKVIELTLVFDQYKAWPKIRKFDKGQLTRRVNKLKKDGLDCEEGMLMTLEKSIASWYQWTTPIRERELKKKEEKPNTLVYH